MSKFSVIDENFSPWLEKNKAQIYSLFNTYFEQPMMTKIKDVDSDYSVYMAKIYALLGIEFRYLVAITEKDDLEKGTCIPLKNLKWITFQTRTLKDEHDIPFHNYIPRRLPGLDAKIYLTNKDATQYNYDVEGMPLRITVIPAQKNSDYSSSGTLISALETYQTIVSIVT